MTEAAARALHTIVDPITFLGLRLLGIFREPSSWAEFFWGVSVLAYSAALFISDQPPEKVGSLDLLTDLLPGWWWPSVCAAGGLGQLAGVILRVRFLRVAAAFGMLLWTGFLFAMISPLYPYSPLLWMTTTSGSLLNAFVVARNARDW